MGAAQELMIVILSKREKQVLQYLYEGRKHKEIAGMLSISVKTSEAHAANLRIKLRAASTNQAIGTAMALGLIEVGNSLS